MRGENSGKILTITPVLECEMFFFSKKSNPILAYTYLYVHLSCYANRILPIQFTTGRPLLNLSPKELDC